MAAAAAWDAPAPLTPSRYAVVEQAFIFPGRVKACALIKGIDNEKGERKERRGTRNTPDEAALVDKARQPGEQAVVWDHWGSDHQYLSPPLSSSVHLLPPISYASMSFYSRVHWLIFPTLSLAQSAIMPHITQRIDVRPTRVPQTADKTSAAPR